MILFKCIKCGAVIDAQDEYVGCQAACTYCGAEQEIPTASDPSCVLVFTESSPPTGTPMTAAELHVRIDEGTVRPSDLIWSDGMWQPLNAVFELPEPKEIAGHREEVPELAVAFEELPPGNRFSENERGLGAAEMADAILHGEPQFRTSKELGLHVLEVLEGMLDSGSDQSFRTMTTSCGVPFPFYE